MSPKPMRFQFDECPLVDLIAAVFDVPAGHRVALHWMKSFGN